ncbi:DUF4157 domain-containing protein [Pseudanabaena sp. 'Roaring Creek']|uniref:eCIS core domain-containing protein n=1 Tax=Pseudanabaena sp. 'Roaring Creek' TaxID=1681830 RepID=UPI000AC81AC2|nr:DUF4157 domain-containing protein [Pseudanabaena sp. 'Roaring Creek']
MKHTYEESHKPITSAKSTNLNLQTRDFSQPQTDEDIPKQTIKNSGNILGKVIFSPKSEFSPTSIQRKTKNPLRAVSDLHTSMPIQAKLNIGEPNDKYEKEADDTASKVVQQINSPKQAKPVQKQESMQKGDEKLRRKPLVQRRENIGGGEASLDLESSIQNARGRGQSLDPHLQSKMGQAMGADFSSVKVHTDTQSDHLNKSIQAKAFTTGQDVFFRQGAYDPSSRSGQELIAHELTHVIQQGAPVRRKLNISKMEQTSLLTNDSTSTNTSPVNTSIQRLMTAKDFKKITYSRFHQRKRIAAIDECLKKIEQSGADSILLSELLNVIDVWLNVADEDSERRSGVEKLRLEVVGEIAKIGESLSNEMDPDEMPTTRERRGAMSAEVTGAGKTYSGDFSDFDSKQFRVSGRAPNRRIEEVKRKKMRNGKVVYYAMGLVTGFNGKAAMIAPYPEPISLGDWYPQVTHINGMAVAPKSGILSAAALQESVNKALDGQNDAALGQDAVDVLYTYSAQRGGTVGDLIDCIKGKVEVRDKATEKQEEIMLDAVHRQKRVTVSAHSRGTIKTDNAVRAVHKILAQEFIPIVQQSADNVRRVQAYCQYAYEEAGILPDAMAAQCYKVLAAEKAKEDMNSYVQLIYAGNAVQHPSRFIDISIYVGGMDPVSMFVGTYSEIGRKVDAFIGTGGSENSKLHSVGKGKGHGFVGNYIPDVSQEIASDITKR